MQTLSKTETLGYSPNALNERQAELLAIVKKTMPELVSDNQLNLEKLKALLGYEGIAPDEHYELNWARHHLPSS